MLILQFVIIETVIFLIVIFILRRLMIQNTQSAVSRLKTADEENKKRIAEMKKKIEEAQTEYQKKTAELAGELEKQREEAKKKLEEEKTGFLGRAREESERILGTAKSRSAQMELAVEKELQARVAGLAAEVVQNVLSQSMKTALNNQLIDEALSEFEALDIGQVPEQAGEAGITTPAPLSPEAGKKIRMILQKKVGRAIEIRETVKKGMAGGIVLSLGSLVIDGSLDSRLEEATKNLKKEV